MNKQKWQWFLCGLADGLIGGVVYGLIIVTFWLLTSCATRNPEWDKERRLEKEAIERMQP
jgi:hypothetical protein